MKTEIHPTFHADAKTTCSCGNIILAGSTVKEQHTEICSACHPFYTGKQKLIDTAGRVEKFMARRKKAESLTQSETAQADNEDNEEETETESE